MAELIKIIPDSAVTATDQGNYARPNLLERSDLGVVPGKPRFRITHLIYVGRPPESKPGEELWSKLLALTDMLP